MNEIEGVISRWIERYPLSSDDNLSGFVIDVDHFFGSRPVFTSIDISITTSKSSLLNAFITIGPEVHSLQQIATTLQSAWTDVMYLDFQATSIVHYKEATVLRFMTGSPASGLGVTGTFFITGRQYPRLVERYNRDFGHIGKEIGAIPNGIQGWTPNQAL